MIKMYDVNNSYQKDTTGIASLKKNVVAFLLVKTANKTKNGPLQITAIFY